MARGMELFTCLDTVMGNSLSGIGVWTVGWMLEGGIVRGSGRRYASTSRRYRTFRMGIQIPIGGKSVRVGDDKMEG